MAFDKKIYSDIIETFYAHLGKRSLKNYELAGVEGSNIASLTVSLNSLDDYLDNTTERTAVPIEKVWDYHRNLGNACSALSVLCNDRGLVALFNTKDSKFVFKSKNDS
jgi:hypothetical protein